MITQIAFQKSEKYSSFLDVLVSASITIWTKSKFYHVAIKVGDYWYTSLPSKGVVKFTELPLEDYEIIEVKHRKLHPEQYAIMMEYIESQIGLGYDWVGILFSQVFSFGINSSSKWFCSEYTTKILQLMYVKEVIDEIPNKVSPARLYQLLKGTK